MRELILNDRSGSCYGGHQYEDKATVITWELPEEFQTCNYILSFSLPNDTSESIPFSSYPIVYSLTQNITQMAGIVTAQLTVLDNNNDVIYKSQLVKIHITESINMDNTVEPYVSELTEAIEKFIAATNQLGKIAITGERKESSVDISITDQTGDTKMFSVYDGDDYILSEDDKKEISQLVRNNVRTETDTPLIANTEYYIGNQDKVTLIFDPNNRKIKQGDTIYINFTSGDTPTILSSSACKGLKSFVPNANSICEIHAQFDGTNWVCLTAQTEV